MAHLEFTLTVSPCLGCSICPQKKLGTAYHGSKSMSLGDYESILHRLPEDVEIHFSGFAEPFLHPDAAVMMRVASMKGRKVFLYSTLMGFSDITSLKHVDFQLISIHAPDAKHLRIDATRWFRQYDYFRQLGFGHEVMCLATDLEDTDTEVVEGLKQRGKELRLLDHPLSRGGNLWKPRHLTGRIKCGANRWHSNVVLPNGDVVICCMDYGLTMPLGNLLRQPYSEIHAKAEEYAANSNPPDNSICRDCEWACKS